MTGKIFKSTFLTSVLVLIISLVLTMGILFGFFEGQLKKELRSEADYIEYAVTNDEEGFFKNFSSGEKRITLIGADGTVLEDTSANPAEMDNHADREEVKDALEKGSGTSVRYSKTLTEKTVYYACRMENGNVLRISTTQYTVMTVVLGLLQPLIYVLVLALILSFALSSRVSKSVIKPINEIDLDHPENSDAYEELTPLLHRILNQQKTIKKQLDEAKKHRDEFNLITENMSEGFLITDREGRLLSCNGAALKLLDAEENDATVLSLNRTGDFRKTVHAALSGERAENTMTHGENTYNLIANPVFEGDKTIGAVIVIIDVTESRRRELIRREFTANVSHELKTPLTSISGFAELLSAGGVPEDTVTDFAKTIYTEAQRLISLVSDIIKISELDEKSVCYEKENVNITELSRDVARRLKMSADKKNVKIGVSGEDISVYGVRKILDEMIFNLCDNAVKYNKEGGTVEIRVKKENGKTVLSVRDTGIGIAPSQQSRVFERFYRVDKSRSKAEGGTGLGLSIVKHGAMYHGAEIKLTSTPGEGTEVTVIFG